MDLSVCKGFLRAREGTKPETCWQGRNSREIAQIVLKQDVAILLFFEKAMSCNHESAFLVVVTKLDPVGKRVSTFFVTLTKALISPGEKVFFDGLAMWRWQDKEVERSPVVL